MKSKLVFILVFVLFTVNVFAQGEISGGNILIGGNFEFSHYGGSVKVGNNTADKNPRNVFTLKPTIGYALSDKLMVGAGIGYTIDKTEYEPTGAYDSRTESSSMFFIEPFARYYALGGECGSVFIEANLGYGIGKYSDERKLGNTTVTTENDLSKFSLGIHPGVSLKVTDKINIEATFGFFGFEKETVKDGNNKDIDTYFGLRLNPVAGFGVNFIL